MTHETRNMKIFIYMATEQLDYSTHIHVIISIAEHKAFVAKRLEWFGEPLLQPIPRNLATSHHIQNGLLRNKNASEDGNSHEQ